jgi:PAS domain S-box-containing protein
VAEDRREQPGLSSPILGDAPLGAARPGEPLVLGTQTERLLGAVATQLTAALDAMPELVAVIGGDHTLVRVNRAMASVAGAHPRDLIGRKCHEVLHGLDRPWPECPHRQALRDRKSVTREILDPRVGLPLEVTCTPVPDGEGALLGTVHVARDISEQKRAAQLRETLIAELQQALASVRQLNGLLPICSFCKRIRDDRGYWEQVEVYIRDHSQATFSHGLCPECMKAHYPDFSA